MVLHVSHGKPGEPGCVTFFSNDSNMIFSLCSYSDCLNCSIWRRTEVSKHFQYFLSNFPCCEAPCSPIPAPYYLSKSLTGAPSWCPSALLFLSCIMSCLGGLFTCHCLPTGNNRNSCLLQRFSECGP